MSLLKEEIKIREKHKESLEKKIHDFKAVLVMTDKKLDAFIRKNDTNNINGRFKAFTFYRETQLKLKFAYEKLVIFEEDNKNSLDITRMNVVYDVLNILYENIQYEISKITNRF